MPPAKKLLFTPDNPILPQSNPIFQPEFPPDTAIITHLVPFTNAKRGTYFRIEP
jgi:hypothetical protein